MSIKKLFPKSPSFSIQKSTHSAKKNVSKNRHKKSSRVVPSIASDRAEQNLADFASQIKYIKVRVNHALNLYNPCTARSCKHPFVPRLYITVNGDVNDIRVIEAQDTHRNHTGFQDEVIFPVCASTQQNESTQFSIRIALSTYCPNRSEEILVGRSPELIFRSHISEKLSIANFFTIYSTCGIPMFKTTVCAGRIKLCIEGLFQSKEAASLNEISLVNSRSSGARAEPNTTVQINKESRASDTTSADVSTSVVPLPAIRKVYFLDALTTKRKELRKIVPILDQQSQPNSDCNNNVEKSTLLLQEIQADLASIGLLLPHQSLRILQPIGEGAHAAVYTGILQTCSDGRQSETQIAAKKFRFSRDPPPVKVLELFQHEYRILSKLTAISKRSGDEDSSIAVRLIGAVLDPCPTLITEYCDHGSLYACQRNPDIWSKVTPRQKLHMAILLSGNISKLHQCGIIHRDIKSHNIVLHGMLTSTPTVKLCDFGTAIEWNADNPLLTDQVGTAGYTAPEIFGTDGYSNAVDVWSFGIVLWELSLPTVNLTNGKTNDYENPFQNVHGDKYIQLVIEGKRPRIYPEQTIFTSILESCWAYPSSTRACMDEIHQTLKSIDLS